MRCDGVLVVGTDGDPPAKLGGHRLMTAVVKRSHLEDSLRSGDLSLDFNPGTGFTLEPGATMELPDVSVCAPLSLSA